MLEKLKFWKKEEALDKFEPDEFSLDHDPFGESSNDQLGLEMDQTAGLGGTTSLSSQSTAPRTRQPAFTQSNEVIQGPNNYLREIPSQSGMGQSGISAADMHEKDLEIISSKLDAIRAMLESINQRLEHVERQNREAYKRW